jgi:cbb3-type cytochrome c oxidase subunit III
MKALIPAIFLLLLTGVVYAASADSGAKLYKTYCSACHGLEGKGVPGAFPALNNQDFLKSKDDNFIKETITNGRPGTAMRAFSKAKGGPFQEAQIDDLVAFIRSWEVKEGKTEGAVEEKGKPLLMGEALFNARCVACHGKGGKGTEAAPALLGNKFVAENEASAVKKVISGGRVGKGMPQWKGILTDEQIDSLVTLLKGWKKKEIGVHLPQWDIGLLVFGVLFTVMVMVYIYKNT